MGFSYQNSKGQTYFLHTRKAGKGGNGEIFFFAKSAGENAAGHLPEKYEVIENLKTGLPIIRKKA